jgi:hypothetical protein
MKPEEFVAMVRSNPDKLRVDRIVVQADERDFQGKGMLKITEENIELQMTLDPGEKAPESRSGVFTKKDCWKLRGVIEDQIEFRCDYVGPGGSQSSFHQLTPDGSYDVTSRIRFDLHPIDLIPNRLDALTTSERRKLFGQREQEPDSNQGKIEPVEKPMSGPKVNFIAKLREYPAFILKGGPELKGEMTGYDFTLKKDATNGDVSVELNSKEDYGPPNEADDWRKFQALMDALAFVHGSHAWPYRIEYWRDGRKITDRVTSAKPLPRTHHSPFSEALAFNARTGNLNWDYAGTIKTVAAFFDQDSILRNEVASILFLFREADHRVHSEITILAMCTLFENLVQLLFKELKLKEKAIAENPNLALFEESRAELDQFLAKRVQELREKGAGYERLRNILRSAALFSMREKLQAIVTHFGLKWENDIETVFNTWKTPRNQLVHDASRSGLTEDQIKESILNESRIAGGINILLLKLFGYNGVMRTSVFEEKYRQV